MSRASLAVVWVANGYPPDVGGWEVYNGEYARRLAKRGHRVEVFTWDTGNVEAAAHDAGSPVPVRRAPWHRRAPRWAGAAGRALDPRGLDALIARTRPDVVVASGGSKALVAAIACAARRAPLVVSVHDLRDEGRGRGALRRAWYRRRYGLQRAARVLANSRDTRERVLALGVPPERVAVVHPGVDTSAFAPDPAAAARARAELRLSSRRVLLTVAALRRIKGHARVIEALPALAARFPDLVYAIVGGGRLHPSLARLAEERGVAARVRFAGRVADTRPWYHACDVFVLPSLPRGPRARAGEGFGIALAEAAACGRPAVASSSGGARDVVADGETGWLVAPEDDAGLTRALADLLGDRSRARAFGLRARERAQRFDWELGTDALEAELRAAAGA